MSKKPLKKLMAISSKGDEIDLDELDEETQQLYISSRCSDLKFLESYIHYEPIDPKSKVSYERFQADYGYGLVWYRYRPIWYCPNGWENPEGRQLYRITEDDIDEDEQKILAPYCECSWHKANWFKKKFICKCCVGCLDEDRHDSSVIRNARKRIFAIQQNKS